MDHALRLLFAFLVLYLDYDILCHYYKGTGFDVELLRNVLYKLNRQIETIYFISFINYHWWSMDSRLDYGLYDNGGLAVF